MMNNIIVLDLETAKSADDCKRCGMAEDQHGLHGLCETREWRVLGARFAKIGWDDKATLGLSIGCYYDYTDTRCHFFDVHTLAETVRHFVETQPLLVSFNGIAFDFPLMRGILRKRAEEGAMTDGLGFTEETTGERLGLLCDAFKTLCATSYDILAAIWKIDLARRLEHGLNSLDAISKANGYGGKLSHGAEAPRRWARGEYAHVINYCQDDVLKTKALFEQIVRTGQILRGDGLPVRLPLPASLVAEGHTHDVYPTLL